MSWVRRPSGGMAKYISLATSSSSFTGDVESEIKQLSDDGSSNGDDYDDDNSSSISIFWQLQEKVDYRIYRRFKRIMTVILCISLIAGSFTLIITRRNRAKVASLKSENQYITNKVSKESIADCTDCEPYSALPDWVLPMQSYELFDSKSMDRWISTGKLFRNSSSSNDNPIRSSLDFSNQTRLDGVTFWVNGSDPRHKAARFYFAKNVSQMDLQPLFKHDDDKFQSISKRNEILNALQGLQNTDNRFRDQNELLYSLRSAKESLKEDLRTLHIISTDFWENEKNEIKGKQDRLFESRIGQLPSWLNVSSEMIAFGNELSLNGEKEEAFIRFHHDWETFAPLIKTRENINQWKMKRLPSFNSIAAEAVLGVNLPTLSEYSFLASDDMFLGQRMSTADFVTPLYGPVLHLDMHHIIKPSAKPWSLGEMAGLRYSIHLLKERFGTRQFPYPLHVHKALSKSLVIESKMMWKQEFENASAERFRGNGLMANSHMLLNGLTVERHREALLWSFLISKIDTNGDGVLNMQEKQETFKQMGTDGYTDIIGRMTKRFATNPNYINRTLDAVSFPNPLSSEYIYSSLDGYALSVPSNEFKQATEILFRDGPPRFFSSKKDSIKQSLRFSVDYCRVSMKTCWPPGENEDDDIKTVDIFTLFAFQEPSCGDCLIMHLIEQSGSGGLEAFLPPKDNTTTLFPSSSSLVPTSVPAHLPLGQDWKTLDFSLSAIASNNRKNGWNKREFSVALIQRYNYVIASSSAKFEQIRNPSSAKSSFKRLLDIKPAFICINDDIRSWRLDQVQTMMKTFFESMWPSSNTRLPFERV